MRASVWTSLNGSELANCTNCRARVAVKRARSIRHCWCTGQTAIQDFANLPDEAIGLPGGLTQAGVPSVLSTLWSVNDASTALLMVRFYELLLQDRLPPPVALRQAQLWLRDATNAELDAYLSWHEAIAAARQQQAERMPLTAAHALLGQVLKGDPNERPYAHPFYWAPFVFYGAEEAL